MDDFSFLLAYAPHYNGAIMAELDIPGHGTKTAVLSCFCIVRPNREEAERAMYESAEQAVAALGAEWDPDDWTVTALHASAEAN